MDNAQTQNADAGRPVPVGWIVMWPKPGGGYSPVYRHGADRPDLGEQLQELLRQFAVYASPPEVAAECKLLRHIDALRRERDELAARLAEVEAQPPVAWIEHELQGTGLRHLHFERRP